MKDVLVPAVIVFGLVMAFSGLAVMLDKRAQLEKLDRCARLCAPLGAEVKFHQKSSDECYCVDRNELKLKAFFR